MFFLPVMLLLFSGGSARVVRDFHSECGQFFANRNSPTVFRPPRFRQICQTLNNKPYFATLYDTYKKIPVYSAYVFTGWMNCTRTSTWYIEPQLEDVNGDPNMAQESIPVENQASNRDYIGSGFHKGHLAPVYLANSQSCAEATFTLTNAAPQHPSFNSGEWRAVEMGMKKILTSCTSPAYIVTGVVPGYYNMRNGVNVPSYFWTAYCCQRKAQIISGGYIGINKNEQPVQTDLRWLEITLTVLYNVEFTLFDNNCRYASYVEFKKKTRLLTVTLQKPKVEDAL